MFSNTLNLHIFFLQAETAKEVKLILCVDVVLLGCDAVSQRKRTTSIFSPQ
jgi:hypothetical protein